MTQGTIPSYELQTLEALEKISRRLARLENTAAYVEEIGRAIRERDKVRQAEAEELRRWRHELLRDARVVAAIAFAFAVERIVWRAANRGGATPGPR
jgi:hypothetical protein